MALFDNFPYTNFHELNLDWVVRILKALDGRVDVLGEDVKTLTDEVKNFIENADIPGVVRDELLAMYEDGRLAELVSEAVVAISDKIVYHFVGGGNTGSRNSYGSPTILECVDGLILFDFGYNQDAMNRAIMATGKTKIKAIVISHFHDDHIYGFDAVASNPDLDFTECQVFYPHEKINWDRVMGTEKTVIQQDMAAVKNTLAGLVLGENIHYPKEGEKYAFDNLSLQFFNLSENYFNGYYDYMLDANGAAIDRTQYNNFSMITVVDHFSGGRAVLPGDIHDPAEKNCFRAFMGANIVQAAHHGLNRICAPEYVNALAPDVFIIGTGATAYPIQTYYHADYSQANAAGAECYYTFDNKGVTVEDSARGIKATPVDGIKANCNTPASPFFNMGIAWTSDELDAGIGINDLDEITFPSVYSAQNSTIAGKLANAPFTNSGFWLITREVGANHALLQEAYAIGVDYYMRAYRRAAYQGTDSNTWLWDNNGWQFDSAAQYAPYSHALAQSDFRNAGTVEIHTGVSQNYVRECNNVIWLGIDVTTGAAISSGTVFMSIAQVPPGQGCYSALVSPAGEVYPVSVRYTDDGMTVRAERAIPANTRISGSITCMRQPTRSN